MIVPIISSVHTSRTCSAPGFWVEHDGASVIRSGNGLHRTIRELFCASTQQEVDAEIARLGLTPLPLTGRQKAAATFAAMPASVRQQFGPAFQALTAVPDNALFGAVSAIEVPPSLQGFKDALLADLS